MIITYVSERKKKKTRVGRSVSKFRLCIVYRGPSGITEVYISYITCIYGCVRRSYRLRHTNHNFIFKTERNTAVILYNFHDRKCITGYRANSYETRVVMLSIFYSKYLIHIRGICTCERAACVLE